jgi:DNA modification methylase
MNLSRLQNPTSGIKSFNVEDVSLFNTDNFQWLPDGSIDLILTDPPFNIARDTNFHTYEGNTINSFRFDAGKGWDSHSPEAFRLLMSNWTQEFSRVLRPGGSFAVFCADEYLSDLIGFLRAAGLKPRRTVTWRKPNAVPINRKHMMMSACEYIIVGVKGSKSVFNADIEAESNSKLTQQEIVAMADKAGVVVDQEIRKMLAGIESRLEPEKLQQIISGKLSEIAEAVATRSINIYNKNKKDAEICIPNYVTFNSKAGNRLHPTEKPVALLCYLIELFSHPGDIVLDPFAGSASLGEAAISTGRKSILVERDQEFFEKAQNRLSIIYQDRANQLLK